MQGHSAYTSTVLPAWVNAEGPADDVVLSTRARLARNIEGIPFPSKARAADLRRVADAISDAVYESGGRFGKLRVIRPGHLSESDRLALVDARVASREHVSGGSYRPVVLNDNGTLSLMVNEEDHLRIQYILPGFQPMTALQMVREFDSFLGKKIRYARADNYGYLTASLANVGTGLRLSVLLHLGGLGILGEVTSALTAAAELRISVRGLLGEGTGAYGDLYQVSNETTIGLSDREIASRVRAAAEHLVARERDARRILACTRREDLISAVHTARERLMEARELSGRAAMACLSVLRLGSEFGIVSDFSLKDFNELLISMQLAISASDERGKMGSLSDDIKRAKLIRARLGKKGETRQLAFPENGEPDRQPERHSK